MSDGLLQTSSESIVSAESCPTKIEGSCLLGFHSKSDQSLRFGGNLGGSGIKFSRSENQLATIGTSVASGSSGNRSGCDGNGGDKSDLPLPLLHPTHPAGGRKVSVPIPCLGPMLGGGSGNEAATKLTEKLTFNPKIYSNHSQSDTTISNHPVLHAQDSVSSASLHNLYRHCSSSQITVPIPSVVVSSGSPVGSPIRKTFTRTSPIPPHVHVKGQGQRHTNPVPPPVPPRRTLPPPPPTAECSTNETSPPKSWSNSSGSSLQETEITSPLVPQTGIIQVYAAYDCGLSPGTSVRLQITNQTTSDHVVDLVVKQLNSEVVAKGESGPIYAQSSDFVLVSVIGARERCLRGDFRPLHLQNPWKSGRLFVRLRKDITAAIALNNRSGLTYP